LLRDRFRFGLGFGLGVALVIGGCGNPSDQDHTGSTGGWRTLGCGVARVPQHVTVGDVTLPTTPPELEAVMDRIGRAGRDEFADSFAGLEVDQERVRAVVYRVPSEAFDDFIRRTAGNACIVVRDARHSSNDLAAWHDRVVADLPFWSHQGIRIVSIGARHDGSGVEIGATEVERASRELTIRYGAQAPLLFEDQAPVRPLTPGSATTTPPPPA
jgi:hypothetical protein